MEEKAKELWHEKQQNRQSKNFNKIRNAIQADRKRPDTKTNAETEKLIVDEFFDMKPLKLPPDAWKDHKKLTRFLGEVQTYVNKLVKACQIQSRLTATELVARPTYSEEFQNIRDNVHKAVA